MLGTLRLIPGLNPFLIYNFKPAALDLCQVLILPQARNASDMDADVRLRIRKWVENGGRLLLTHDAVGYRSHQPIVPDVCLRGLDLAKRATCIIVAEHPVTRGLALRSTFDHSYPDHVTLSPGASGKIVVTDATDNSPVVVVGDHGKGRVIASGLATGLGRGDADASPTGGELQLLLNAVKWLAE
jgi:uncharacterized membrane protein